MFRLDDERALVQTVDFFPPIVDDPLWFGRIAAANALSDVYAMGGRPLTALNIVGWPRELDMAILAEVLGGGFEKVQEAGAVLCGGHSVTDHEVKFGMAVTGLVHPARWWSNARARPGDVLLLTKPLGMGPVSTAIKRDLAPPAMALAAMQQMATLNRAACEAMAGLDIHAATDVTGFGLIGHGCEMAAGAGLRLVLEASALPVFPGVLDLVRGGVTSGGCNRGKAHYGARVRIEASVDAALRDLIHDAETSGGLLLALAERDMAVAQRRLADAGTHSHAAIGRFEVRAADSEQEPWLVVR